MIPLSSAHLSTEVALRSSLPFISIGVPTYKRTDLLRQTLASIVAQTGDHDYEVIVCDNGGLPETRAIVAEFPSDRFFLHINTPACSATENWLRCIQLARGTWVTVLHDDDLLYPWYLDTVTAHLREDTSAVYVLTAKGETPPDLPRPDSRGQSLIYHPGYFLKNSMTAFPGVLFRRKLALEIGGFNARFVTVADYLFWYRLSCAGRLLKVHTIAAFYRVHGGQGTQDVWPLMLREGHLLRIRICHEQFAGSRLSRWIARYFTYHNARGFSRRFSNVPAGLTRALKFKAIPCTWLPKGWVWAITKLLAHKR